MQWSNNSNRGNAAAGQFATPEWVARLLSSRLRKAPNSAADLGIGKGALATALRDRFAGTSIIGIDKHTLPRGDRATMKAQGMRLLTRDIGHPNFPTWFRSQFGGVDAVVSNPPFTYIGNAPALQQLFMDDGFGNTKKAKNQRLDLVFLLHARRLLNHGGEMAFILPKSAFAMVKSTPHLQLMVDRFGLKEIITLPSKLYQDAEVETAVLIFRPDARKSASAQFALYTARCEGELELLGRFKPSKATQEIAETIEGAASVRNTTVTIASLGGTIARGRHSSNALMHQGVTHFHTTSFQDYPTAHVAFKYRDRNGVEAFDTPAQEGDILIARVGTRCIGRAAIVVSGSQHISDCVYRISTPVAKRRKIWEFISSEAGRTWQLSLARGACAKFITQHDLLSATLPQAIR